DGGDGGDRDQNEGHEGQDFDRHGGSERGIGSGWACAVTESVATSCVPSPFSSLSLTTGETAAVATAFRRGGVGAWPGRWCRRPASPVRRRRARRAPGS